MTTALAPTRAYKFSDGRLIELCFEKIAVAERDATELATVGITPEWVEDFEERVLAFGAMPTDTIELGEQKEATEQKEEEADDLMDKLKELRSAAKRALGEKSAAYGKFGFREMDQFGDKELSRLALVIPALTTKYATELATKGWDAADNTALQTLLNAFVDGMQNQILEVDSRDTATENRIKEGNAIFNLLDNELCEAGKGYWRTISEAKYNDYIIFNNAAGSANIATREGNVPSGGAIENVNDITEIATTPESEIIVEIDGALSFSFAVADNVMGTTILNLVTGTHTMLVEEFKTLTGFDAIPGTPFLNVQNNGFNPVHYKLTFTELENP